MTKKLFAVITLLNLGIILFFWVSGSWRLFVDTPLPMKILALARLYGLLGVFCVLLQFVFIGRITWIERAFGLDTLALIHRKNGRVAFTFVALHVLFILWSYSLVHETNLLSQLLEFISEGILLRNAFLAFVLLVFTVGFSIYIVFKRLKYEFWYYVHLLNYAVVLLAFSHQWQLGGDFINQLFVYYWWALYTVVLGGFVVFRWLRPIVVSYKHQFYVKDIVHETPNATTLIIGGKNLEQFRRKSGQFMILRFLDNRRFWQAHPFSLSWAAHNEELRVTIKNSGDFTSDIRSINKGTKIMIDGMYGVFTTESMKSKKILYIAGGVGITPIRSLIEETKDSHDIVLLYANKTIEEIIFKQELDSFSHESEFPLHHILTEEKGYQGETGHIDEEKIKRLVPDVLDREVFLCGPEGFMKAIIGSLTKLGVKKENIHYENFSLH